MVGPIFEVIYKRRRRTIKKFLISSNFIRFGYLSKLAVMEHCTILNNQMLLADSWVSMLPGRSNRISRNLIYQKQFIHHIQEGM